MRLKLGFGLNVLIPASALKRPKFVPQPCKPYYAFSNHIPACEVQSSYVVYFSHLFLLRSQQILARTVWNISVLCYVKTIFFWKCLEVLGQFAYFSALFVEKCLRNEAPNAYASMTRFNGAPRCFNVHSTFHALPKLLMSDVQLSSVAWATSSTIGAWTRCKR